MHIPLGFVVVVNTGEREATMNYGNSSCTVMPGEKRAVLQHVAKDLRHFFPFVQIQPAATSEDVPREIEDIEVEEPENDGKRRPSRPRKVKT